MSDAAAFFAQKKKKKAFKFNANLVDASTVSSALHADVTAHSGDQDPLSVVNSNGFSPETRDSLDQKTKENESSEQWDDEAMVANTFRKNVVVVSNTPSTSGGLLDMKSFDPKRTDPDNIAEKLRVEETKAQLAAAREGMEREAAKLKEERERKELAKLELEKSRLGTASSSTGKWVAPSLRAAKASVVTRPRIGGSSSQKLDVQDEELFPDLAAADKILEKKERDKAPVIKAPKKTPVGGGASWASKPITTKEKVDSATAKEKVDSATAKEKVDSVAAEPSSEPDSLQTDAVPETETKVEDIQAEKLPPTPALATEAVNTQHVAKKTVTKKKKKDLSTFKPGT